ncbi:MAG: pantetheine-phosphate adenylyltransferase [Thermoanaerobaculia bacterium]
MKIEQRAAVYPGSFDPVTRGHLDIIMRGSRLFDKLVVAVLENPEKTPVLAERERVDLIARAVEGNPRVEVRSFRGLVARLAAELGAGWILRGLRSEADLAAEMPMAISNRLAGGRTVETVFLPTRPELSFISSRLVRDIARHGGDLAPFVTPPVAKSLRKALRGGGAPS